MRRDNTVKFVWEHNGNDTLLYSVDCVGAYTRGETLDIAINKIETELKTYSSWKNQKSKNQLLLNVIFFCQIYRSNL